MAQKTPFITVVGSFVVGITIKTSRFPVAGESLIGSDFDLGPGGKGSNQAVGITRMGGQCHLLLKIGRDDFAKIALDLYAQEKMDLSGIIQVADANTGVAIITVNQAGENHIVLDVGANAFLSPEDVNQVESKIARSDVVLSVLEISAETAGRAMALGRGHGALTILNPAPATPLSNAILENVDVITPNETEIKILLGLEPSSKDDIPELAKALQMRGVKNVVVTQGASGALVLDEWGALTQVPGIKVDVVDTTGAGDAFNAALATALGEGKTLLDAVKMAVIAGGLCCTKLGVIPAMPHRQEIEGVMG